MNPPRLHHFAFVAAAFCCGAELHAFTLRALQDAGRDPNAPTVPAAQDPSTPPPSTPPTQAPGSEEPAPAPPRDAAAAEPPPAPIVPPTEFEPAPIAAILTRLTDPVAYLDAEAKAETFLFHWEKKRDLRPGDGFRQGVAGLSELYFPLDSANVRCFGETHAFLVPTDGEHRLRLHAVRRLLVEARLTPFVLELDGGTTLTFSETVLRFELDDRNHRWIVQNDGPGEVRLAGPVLPPMTAAVAAGQRVEIPRIVAPEIDAPASLANATRDVWDGKTVATHGEVRVTRRSSEIEFEGSGVVSVGGARLVLDHSRVRVWKPR